MLLTIDNNELTQAIDQIMEKRGYAPASDLTGKTIGIEEFAKKYCYPHGTAWVKSEILYKYHPSWVANIHPGKGRGFTIFEKEASDWMAKNRNKLNW